MTEVAKTKTTYYNYNYELETQKLNPLSDKSFQVLLKFNAINFKGNVLSVKALFNDLGEKVFDIEVKSSIFGRGSNSENGVFNFKLPISEEDKAKPFLLMAKVFNSVQTTNLVTTIAKYNKLQSNTLSMKLFGKNRVSTTTSKIFKVIGLESIANSSDGVNYTLKGATTIKSDESLSIPLGKNIKFDQPFTNNGEFILGSNNNSESVKWQQNTTVTTTAEVSPDQPYNNTGYYTINSGATLTIDSDSTFNTSYQFTNKSGGNVINNGKLNNTLDLDNFGTITINSGGLLTNVRPDTCSTSRCSSDWGRIWNYDTITGEGSLNICTSIQLTNIAL